MPSAKTKSTPEATISAKVIRADGTEEDLGVISVTSADAERMLALMAELKPDPVDDPDAALEEANRRNAEESERNDAETERLRAESPMRDLMGKEG
jgi:hypothetical protein